MKTLTVKTEDSFSSLLELASNNDIEGFKILVDKDSSSINEVGLWYGRKNGSKQIVLEHRTPLMVAATYGSIDVLKLILSCPEADVNLACGVNKSTALHCAASGGSVNAIDAVKLLLLAGADVNCVDVNGNRPVDVIVVPLKMRGMKTILEELLSDNASDGSVGEFYVRVSFNSSSPVSPAHSSNGMPYSPSGSPPSPVASKFSDAAIGSLFEKKEYPIDPSVPDIKNSIYATDEFRMFSFKVRPCSRAYSHDWTECPFVHPGENARRRDPRKFHYSCVPCPDFRKGACRRGDMCEYAHGVFECWLHPAQYRTRLCKDGTSCNRRVCFFAHTAEELRPLYVSSGSAVLSPRSSAASAPNVMDMAAVMGLLPGSPSSVSSLSPSHFAQPMSPSANCMSLSSAAWAQPNVPALHLPGSNLQSSRLRSSLSARDIPPEHLNCLPDFDGQQHPLNDLSCFLQPRTGAVSVSRPGRSKTLTPSNLEELFPSEVSSSPRYSDLAMTSLFSPTHKSAVLNQFQQLQCVLSPLNTDVLSPRNVEHSMLQTSFGVSPSGRMSPRSVEPISPMSARLSAFAQREKQQQQLRSISSRELGAYSPASIVGSPINSWSKWGSPNGKVDWSVNGDDVGHQMQKSSSFEFKNNGEEPDLSWVQSLVKESPPEMIKENFASSEPAASADGLNSNSQIEPIDHSVLGTWLEQVQLDQLVV
ncbi:zinc finger CCCH domain-containing protein 30-like [Abrus precatorius]|uniref:Zinc finger CCCH domain-containing protein 30-like n=1 Tax=Abrus precatorius TaxID=3816 RepID=A0A8B8LR01_ABRPR|nr:zinc finger CCCH domain-containing protein 30-like [Abrus precatorius]XP_027357849.1 zinc finger CCCH domain-containing protein 30-like [Abrus precatorius]XP_027357858.1 zinc finger CCCH domain-containing protein 30-like [Abrus precatorius]